MKQITAVIIMISLLSLPAAYADCQGCCSYHGGVVCQDNTTQCADGTALSDTCTAKDCNACTVNTVSQDDGNGNGTRDILAGVGIALAAAGFLWLMDRSPRIQISPIAYQNEQTCFYGLSVSFDF